MKRFLPVVFLAALVPPSVAQQNPGGGQNPSRGQTPPLRLQIPATTFWKSELPGGTFVVAHNVIREISSQQYIVDAAARVTEVNIDTGGAFKPRFYYIEPIAVEAVNAVPGASSVVEEVQTRARSATKTVAPADPLWTKVVKNYPATTHAGTIEFRLETLDQLNDLYDSVERSWTTGRSETFTIEGVKPFVPTKKKKDDDQDPAAAAADAATGGASPD